MPKFMFRATHPGGGPCHDHVEATNLGQARYVLEVRGYRDIEFYSDENVDEVRRFATSGTGTEEEALSGWSAAEMAAAQKRKGACAKLWWAFKHHLIFLGPLLIWNWFSLRGDRPFGWGDKIGFALSATYLVLFLMMVSPMVFFDQLLQASAWADWAGVRKWIKRTRWLRRITRVGVPELELQIREAYALAAEGYVRDAVQKMQACREHPDLPEAMYFSRLSTVYEYAADYDAMIRCAEAAASKSTGGGGEWIDLATARIRRKCDVAGAKAALEHVDGKEIPVLARAALVRCRGMIASEEANYAEAKARLEEAIEAMKEHEGNPLLQNWLAEARAYLALALDALGERDRARKELADARPLLKANKEFALLRRAEGK